MSPADLLITNARLATMQAGPDPYGEIGDDAVAISDGRIVAIGPAALRLPAIERIDLDGRWLTPGLIDCHTHLVFAGNRVDEFERRLGGVTYEEIAAAGGGIMATVEATRKAGHPGLVASSRRRLQALVAEGVTTVEIKSGYGLRKDAELAMLRAACSLGEQFGVSVHKTFLGAHAVPADWAHGSDAYLEQVVDEMLPAAHQAGLVDSVDAYCEAIAFSPAQVRRLFEKARRLGLPVRLHADQLSDSGAAGLAAEFGALSADHLEYTSEQGVRAMATSGTVAVLLPGAFLTLREAQAPPVEALRDSGVPIAIATDCNPGTSPQSSLLAAMHLATALFRLTPGECLAGVTRHAAAALGMNDRGTIAVGQRADLVAWDFEHPAELSYWLGLHRPVRRFIAGKEARIDR